MATHKKRNWIIILSIITIVFAALLALPFAFRGKIMEITKRELNKQLTAEVNFSTLRLSFLRNFPNASVTLKDFTVIGTGDFAKDTLLFSRDVNLVINLKSLFGDTGYEVNRLQLTDNLPKLFNHCTLIIFLCFSKLFLCPRMALYSRFNLINTRKLS